MTEQNYAPRDSYATGNSGTARKPLKNAPRPYEGQPLTPNELAVEQWRPIKEYLGRYEVSDMGRVRSLPQGKIPINNGGHYQHRGGVIKLSLDRHGYLRFNAKKAGSQKITYVHRAVAIAFLSNPQNLPVVNHIDGNPRCNKLSNLEWVTHKENSQHAVKMGLIKSISSFITSQIIREYHDRKANGETAQSIGERHGISKGTVRQIVSKARKSASQKDFTTCNPIHSHE